MSALVPTWSVTLGSLTLTPDDWPRLVSLRTEASLRAPVNTCELVLAPRAGLAVAPDEPVEVTLGHRDREEAVVFTGQVARVEARLDEVRVLALGSFRRLLRPGPNLAFESPKAGDVVSAVLAAHSVDSGDVRDGPELPRYAVGAAMTGYDALGRLAEQCGFDLFAGTDDKCVFAPYEAGATVTLTYAQSVLEVAVEGCRSGIDGVEVLGESPVSLGQGSDAASWLTKEDVLGSAGDTGGTVLRLRDASARTVELATAFAEARLGSLSATRRARVVTLGQPDVALAGTVSLANLPEGDDGDFKVTAVSHRLDRRRGFVTQITGRAV